MARASMPLRPESGSLAAPNDPTTSKIAIPIALSTMAGRAIGACRSR